MKIYQSVFLKFLWDERIFSSPAVLKMLGSCSEMRFQVQASYLWGFCVTAPE